MIPEEISHYRILKKLGSGGMAEVYLAEDLHLSRRVAIKVLLRGEGSEERLRRFSREAHAASSLSHPHIAHLYEVGRDGDLHFLVMEFVDGKPLDEYIAGRPLPTDQIITFAIQIADALQEAHAKGIIHRDMKPSNVLITARGVKVLDFGLARISAPDGADGSARDTSTRTATGILVGTPPYMAPEQALGKGADARSDLFSLGVVIYQMSTGRLPFGGSTTIEILQHIVDSAPEAVARFNYAIPAELERIIRKCLEKIPEQRYQTATDLLVDLRNLDRSLKNQSAPARLAFRPVRLRRVFPLLPAIILLVLLAGIGLVQYRRSGSFRAPSAAVHSLVVLPVLSPKSESVAHLNSFEQGVLEDLTAMLARKKSLRVIAPASAMAARQTLKSRSAIVEELDVGTIVETAIFRSGDRLRITVQLSDASAGSPRWLQTFEGGVDESLELQRQVAREIQQQIRPEAAASDKAADAPARVDPTAYELYLRARQDRDAWAECVKWLERSLRLDPTFSRAHALLADSYVRAANLQEMPFDQAAMRARAAAAKAAELDPGEPAAHLAAANVSLFLDWDPVRAETSLNTAIELAPNDAEAHRQKAWWGRVTGNTRTELAEAGRVRELDPMSVRDRLFLAEALIHSGKHRDAVAECQKILAMRDQEAAHDLAQQVLAHALIHENNFRDGIALLEKQRSESPGRLSRSIMLAHGYYLAGAHHRVRAILKEAPSPPAGQGSPAERAMLLSLAGDPEGAFRLLDEAYRRHDPYLLFIKEHPFEPLRSDPRYSVLLQRLRLPRG